MRLANISFDENENPDQITVVMSIDEAAKLTQHLGSIPQAQTFPPSAYSATSAMWRCLTHGVFNAHWDDGLDDYLASREGASGV